MSFYNYKVMPHNVANNHRVTRGLPSGGIKYAAPISNTSYNDFSEYLLNKYSSGNNKGLTTNIGEVTTTPEIFADYLKEKYPTGQNAVYTRTESKNTGVGGAPSSQSGMGAGIVGLGANAVGRINQALNGAKEAEANNTFGKYLLSKYGNASVDNGGISDYLARTKESANIPGAVNSTFGLGAAVIGNAAGLLGHTVKSDTSPNLETENQTWASLLGYEANPAVEKAGMQGYALGMQGGNYTDAEINAQFATPEELTAFKKAYLQGMNQRTATLGAMKRMGGTVTSVNNNETVTDSKETEYTEEQNTDEVKEESTPTVGNSAGSGVVIEPSVTAPVSSGSGISLEQYLRNYGGVDTERQFAESVRRANSDYYRTLMTYGKKAEALAGNGLVGGGMSDYGGAAAYAVRQGAVAGAGEIKAQTDASQIKSFSDYLQGTAGGSVLDKHRAAATQIYEQARVNGSSHDAALIAVKNAGYTDQTVLSGLESNYKEAQGANIGFTIGQYLSDKSYSVMGENYVSKDTLDQAVVAGMIDKDGEVYNTQLSRIQEANAANLDKLIKGVHDEGENGFYLEKACAEFGVEYNEESKEEIAEQMIPVLRERAQELYYAGDISEAQYAEYIKKDFEYELEGLADEKNRLAKTCDTLETFFDTTEKVGVGINEELMFAAIKSFDIQKVQYDSTTIGGEPVLKITYKHNNKNVMEKVEFQKKTNTDSLGDMNVISEVKTDEGLRITQYDNGWWGVSDNSSNNVVYSQPEFGGFKGNVGDMLMKLLLAYFNAD